MTREEPHPSEIEPRPDDRYCVPARCDGPTEMRPRGAIACCAAVLALATTTLGCGARSAADLGSPTAHLDANVLKSVAGSKGSAGSVES